MHRLVKVRVETLGSLGPGLSLSGQLEIFNAQTTKCHIPAVERW